MYHEYFNCLTATSRFFPSRILAPMSSPAARYREIQEKKNYVCIEKKRSKAKPAYLISV